jgi:type IV secretion system protein VirB10
MAYQEPEQKTPPGQPEVTRFRKASGRRTLIVSLLSLVLVIALASGGDRLLSALKGVMRKNPTPRRPPPVRCSMSVRIWVWTVTRLACSGREAEHRPCQSERPGHSSSAARAARPEQGGSTGRRAEQRQYRVRRRYTHVPKRIAQQRGNVGQPVASTAYTSCQSVLVSGKMDVCAARIRQHRQTAITTQSGRCPCHWCQAAGPRSRSLYPGGSLYSVFDDAALRIRCWRSYLLPDR